MDEIIRNRNNLTFDVDMHHDYTPEVGYIYDPGRRTSEPWIYTIPERIRLFIKCSDPELFSTLKSIVPLLEEDNVTIDIRDPEQKIVYKIKDEFAEIDDERRVDDEIRKEKVNELLDKLRELGVNVDNVELNDYETPQEYLEVASDTMDYSNAGICVLSHRQTKFFQTMYQTGILEEAIPAWYKEGKSHP